MSWGADDAAGALPRAGASANELVTPHGSDAEGIEAWKNAGYHTAMLKRAHFAGSTDHSQFGQQYTPPANGGWRRLS